MEQFQIVDTSILNFIQENMRSEFLDTFMPFISQFGDNGVVWIILALFLLFIPKQRMTGITIIVALLLYLLVGEMILKPLIGRIRPFHISTDVLLLIREPTDFSFPSGHTTSSFAAATVLLVTKKKYGAIVLILAALIAFSRLYLYVHYPTDVLAGIVFGVTIAFVSVRLVKARY